MPKERKESGFGGAARSGQDHGDSPYDVADRSRGRGTNDVYREVIFRQVPGWLTRMGVPSNEVVTGNNNEVGIGSRPNSMTIGNAVIAPNPHYESQLGFHQPPPPAPSVTQFGFQHHAPPQPLNPIVQGHPAPAPVQLVFDLNHQARNPFRQNAGPLAGCLKKTFEPETGRWKYTIHPQPECPIGAHERSALLNIHAYETNPPPEAAYTALPAQPQSAELAFSHFAAFWELFRFF